MELKDRIIKEAFELFVIYGIRSVTMDQIAGHLGISKRTLYETFKDKNDLLKVGMKFFLTNKKTQALEIVNSATNVVEAIYTFGKWGEDTKRKISPLFFEDIRKYYPEVHELFFTKNKIRDYTITHTLILKGIDQGVFRKDLDADLVNNYVHELMNIIHNEAVFPKTQYSEKEIFKNIIMPYFIGVCTKKGQQLIEQYFEEVKE
ncbi:MAG: helix-turn-helix transcriptional regulator [Bacteroidales bacterium]|nr:helix-turn-helix transcriptional regulator [Bacteroidales bacterium]